MLTSLQLTVPVIGILRGVEQDFFGEIMQASFAMGLEAIEVTMNTVGAEQIVAAHRGLVPPGKYLGMGTVRNPDEAERAVAAGAMFLVTPNLDPAVIRFARSENIPVIVGALTPTEVYNAWAAGADMIKVFPCGALGGARYIRDLRGPFDQVKLVAVGGVTLENAPEYFAAGAAGVGVSSSLFGLEALMERDIDSLSENVGKFLARCPVS
jgi:2-dehydro-3-deoxyphosphogluconate aldolase/(4S)-4-hydroxy-2-oxoglutarate aldolase